MSAWHERIARQEERGRALVQALAESIRQAFADRGPGFFSYVEIEELYSAPVARTSARLCTLYPELIAVAVGGGVHVNHQRRCRERRAGITVTWADNHEQNEESQ